MKLEYKGYILELEEIDSDTEKRIIADCHKICFAVNTSEGYDYVIPKFRRLVDEYIRLWKKEDDRWESERDISLMHKW
jgi:hypothetical protein